MRGRKRERKEVGLRKEKARGRRSGLLGFHWKGRDSAEGGKLTGEAVRVALGLHLRQHLSLQLFIHMR